METLQILTIFNHRHIHKINKKDFRHQVLIITILEMIIHSIKTIQALKIATIIQPIIKELLRIYNNL